MLTFACLLVHRAELDNSVKKYVQETDNSVDEKVDIQEKHAAMKKVHKDLKQSYKSLKDMTEQQMKQTQQFNLVDPRVRELLTLAQGSNMTEDELSSFKASLSLSW